MTQQAMDGDEPRLREQMAAMARRLSELGLNRGASGNLSVRCGKHLLVTPTGMAAEEMAATHMVKMDLAGSVLSGGKPSSEWPFHQAILAARPEIGAVVHTHSTFATVLACQHLEVPPFHYMIAVGGGDSIRCAPYAVFGSRELADHAPHALRDRKACLLANHGMIALGRDLEDACAVAVEVESLCEQYWRILQLGTPVLLSAAQMAEVLEKFKGYGRQAG